MDEITMKFPPLDEQEKDPLSVWQFIRQAMRLRAAFPAIARGKTVPVDILCEEEYAAMIRDDGEHEAVLIAFNVSEQSCTMDVGSTGYTVLSGTLNTSTEYAEVKDGVLTLPAYTVAVLTK